MKDRDHMNISLEVESEHIPRLFPILQSGIFVRTHSGLTIRTFLCEQMGMEPEYVAERIQTIFLDGRPVDDIDSASIKDGSVLALSSSMPGLVGVSLRRGSILSSFRGTITHKEADTCTMPKEGTVQIKLFNIVMKELGPVFLERGILVESSVFSDFIDNQPDRFWRGCKNILLNGKPLDTHLLKDRIRNLGEWVHLKIKIIHREKEA